MCEMIITCAPLPPPHGGITNWYQILTREATRAGVTLANVDTSPKTKGNKRSLFNRLVVQGFGMLAKRRQLKAILREHKGAVCAHLVTSAQFGLVRDLAFLKLLKKHGVPTVYHLHFGRVPEIVNTNGFESRMLKKTVSLADKIIAIDRHTEAALAAWVDPQHVVYIPNPIESVELSFVQHPSENTVLYLGMVYREKGIEELLTAWMQIKTSHPTWTLTIAGACDEDYKTHLKAQYDLDRVRFSGFLPHDQAMRLLSESAFLVLPSYTEGFPNVVVEAMMNHKAVVATAVGAVEDILSGECGIVIPPKEVQPLADALDRLIREQATRESMGQNGYEKARTAYASERVFAQYRAVWQQVATNLKS